MQILVTGDPGRWEELKGRDFSAHTVQWQEEVTVLPESTQLVIDLSLDEQPERAALYAGVPVIGCMVKRPLSAIGMSNIIGCNLLPGFIGNAKLEVAAPDEQLLGSVMEQLGWAYEKVSGDAGMVTPRVVCMIINEAYYTAQEHTATREDIDTSMKLGTNYPAGPFEWCRRIGIKHVYEVLRAVREHTGNERYDICPLLKQEYEAQLS